ncbi:MAG: aminoglycoside phosphotransferase family protein [Nitrospiraceae bacterium]|nr:aminoglycoside phosphotransferase family protein [Nitrospiraceae bacterium]
MEDLFYIAEQFAVDGRIADIRELGNGNINDTFLVMLDARTEKHFILQRINTRVFVDPELVMHNMRIATEHMRSRLELRPPGKSRRWEIPAVLLTRDGRAHLRGSDGSFWRGLSFIEGCRSFETISDERHAEEVGYALGMFHTLLSDLLPDKLADTLEGFHITPRYLRHYDEVLARHSAPGSPEIDYCVRFVNDRSRWAQVLEDAKKRGSLPLRPIHGDPKVDNIMIDAVTGQAAGIVDLDTVKPGLVHYDIGDCLRSGCNRSGEETMAWEEVVFDTDICRAIFRGYLADARRFLTEDDFAYLYDAVRLIAFELGLRFFTDFLEGDVYFKVKQPEHNLVRALVQFRLAGSIESQEAAIRKIIRDLR